MISPLAPLCTVLEGNSSMRFETVVDGSGSGLGVGVSSADMRGLGPTAMDGVASYLRFGGATGVGGEPIDSPRKRFSSAAIAASSSSFLPSCSCRW